MAPPRHLTPSCPLPPMDHPTVQMAHGGGGRMMHQLLERVFLPAFGNPALNAQHDGAVLEVGGARLALTTDSYVVRPLFFPGGDIGTLAVHGTVNDLSMCGARPLCLTAGFLLEEGLPMETLSRVVDSMQRAAREAQVELVTGDTKVVDKGKGDGLYINTAGLGVIEHGQVVAPSRVAPGDAVLLSGDLGRHGTAIMAQREGLEFETTIESDCAPLWGPVAGLLEAGLPVHCLRDLTRGGLASALVEIAQSAPVHIRIDGCSVPVGEDVRGACEILGLDPHYVANEGRMVLFLPADRADEALACLRSYPVTAGACAIGRVEAEPAGTVTLKTEIGVARILDMLSGDQLPRIC